MKHAYMLSAEEVLAELHTGAEGITEREAGQRLLHYGKNEITQKKKISKLKIFIEQFRSVLVGILLGATVLSFMIGEVADAVTIVAILILMALFGFFQEYKASKAIEALKKLTSLKARVVRGGTPKEIGAEELVPGDIIILSEGSKVPADARLIEARNLEVMEAALTGESTPVRKSVDALKEECEIAEQTNMVFSGTVVTKGSAKAVVVSTGMNTEIGKIASMLQEEDNEETPLQKKLSQLGKWLGAATIVVAVVVFLVGIAKGNNAREMFMNAIALAVAAVPEGLPAVVTISLALGVKRMIKRNALVRRLPSVETLGSTTVICTDKTGTLTHNQMTVKRIATVEGVAELTGEGYTPVGALLLKKGKVSKDALELLLKIGVLCNDAELVEEKTSQGKDEYKVIGDPTEAALLVSAEKLGMKKQNLESEFPRIDELPFDSRRKMMSTLHSSEEGTFIFTKGAPDIILDKCSRVLKKGREVPLTQKERKEILAAVEEMAKEALRVLGFAYKRTGKGSGKEKSRIEEKDEEGLVFVGLQAMMDPPRKDAIDAVAKCKDAGIRVIMITGDHKETAVAIAKKVGIEGKAITGKELDKESGLDSLLEEVGVFARVNPEHKLKIVEALKKRGHIVAMTGDGVNDAPALKKADIGVCVGSGTDVAKEASDMILVDDNFASIVSAVEEGRGIYDNIKKFVNFLLSSNFGEVLVLFLGGFMFQNLPLVAIHLLWINLVTDGLPAIALSVDPAAKNVMKRKPRNPEEHIISKNMTLNILAIGLLITVAVFLMYAAGSRESLEKGRTMAFTSLIVLEIARIQMIRRQYGLGLFTNKWLWMARATSIFLQLIVIYTPLRIFFKTVPLSLVDWVLIAATTLGMYFVGLVLSKIIVAATREID